MLHCVKVRQIGSCLLVVAWLAVAGAARAEDKPAAIEAPHPLCDEIATAARRYDLPLDYFTRLIWRESRFQRNAVSPAGAQGVAQFMPKTAAERGLVDPFSPHDAVFQSAAYLSELRLAFGNLGLAAAAYNAGPGRLARWRTGETTLPQETLDYVVAVTGHDVSAWAEAKPPVLAEDKGFSCAHFAELALKAPGPTTPRAVAAARGKDWAVILVGNPQRDKVMAEYQMVKGRFFGVLAGYQPSVVHKRVSGLQIARYIVQIERDTRAEANTLCAKLLRAGGSCFVLANR